MLFLMVASNTLSALEIFSLPAFTWFSKKYLNKSYSLFMPQSQVLVAMFIFETKEISVYILKQRKLSNCNRTL